MPKACDPTRCSANDRSPPPQQNELILELEQRYVGLQTRLCVPLRDLITDRLDNISGDCDCEGRSWRKNQGGTVRTQLGECLGKIIVSRKIAHGTCILPSCNCRHFSLIIPCLNLDNFNLELKNGG